MASPGQDGMIWLNLYTAIYVSVLKTIIEEIKAEIEKLIILV